MGGEEAAIALREGSRSVAGRNVSATVNLLRRVWRGQPLRSWSPVRRVIHRSRRMMNDDPSGGPLYWGQRDTVISSLRVGERAECVIL